jgi:lipoprotein-releasing system permease protein
LTAGHCTTFACTSIRATSGSFAAESRVSTIERHLLQGRLQDLVPGERRMIIGRVLAWQLGAEVGDEITVMVPGRELISSGGRPLLQTFTVVGVFEVGLQDHDAALALVALDDAAALTGDGTLPHGLRLKFDDVMAAPVLAGRVAAAVGQGAGVRDWTQEHAAYFRAIRIEKTMMSLILMLVVAVAAFNIVSTLVMAVKDKQPDIAILRTLGARPGSVLAIFATQGTVIGLLGTLGGVALGVVLSVNLERLVHGLERLLGTRFMDASVYLMSDLPAHVEAADVALIAATAFALCCLSTLYPAWRAARTHPARALRHD